MTKPDDNEIDAIAAPLAVMRASRGGPRGMRLDTGHRAHADLMDGDHAHGDRAHGDHAHGEQAHRDDPHHGHRGHRGDHGPGGFTTHGGRHAAGPARMRMLEALAASGEPMSISAIGEVVGVDQPRASRLVQQAEMMGFVAREVDPDDARRTRVALTEQGRAVATSMRRDRRDRIGTALEQFTPEERADFARLFTKFADAWAAR